MAIAQKEINETIYWLILLKETEYISKNDFENINTDAIEIIKIITTSIKTTKSKLTTNH
jgi:four helix bundle protein